MTHTATYPVICPPQTPPVLSLKKVAEHSDGANSYAEADNFRDYDHRDAAIDALETAQRVLALLGHEAHANE
jgi:hypothetical protein